jgi:hypothetical protein
VGQCLESFGNVALSPMTLKALPLASLTPTSTITVSYQGFPAQAQAAFQYAVNILRTVIVSSVPITVKATWEPLSAGTLAQAAPGNFFQNFNNAPVRNLIYPVAIANAYAGSDLDPPQADIEVSFSSTLGEWYLGTDGKATDRTYDFVTIVLHELAHGLGFFGSADVFNGNGSWLDNSRWIYDSLIQNGAGQAITNTFLFPDSSRALGNQLQSNNLFFNGANARFYNGGNPVKIYAPGSWNPGSSYSHPDTSFEDTINAMMVPFQDYGESIHHYGPVAFGMLQDFGWLLNTQGWIYGTPDSNVLAGTNSTQNLFGALGDDTINALAGDDHLFGGDGNDYLNAQDGNDWLFGEAGFDLLIGGSGNDVFALSANENSSDTIADFTPFADTIRLLNNTAIATVSDLTISPSGGNTALSAPGYSITLAGQYYAANVVVTPTGGGAANINYLPSAATPIDWQIVGATDLNKDGFVDLLRSDRVSGANGAWRLSNGTVTGWLPLPTTPAGWQIVGTADLNSNGTPDVLLSNTLTGENGAWNIVNGSAVGWIPLNYLPVGSGWQITGTADLNGNGPDILLGNTITGENGAWSFANGSVNGWIGLPATGGGWHVTGTAELNNNGFVDILLSNSITGENGAWNMANGAVGGWIGLPATGGGWQIVGSAELNNNGFTDILLSNTVTGENGAWNLVNGAVVGWIGLPTIA